MNEKILVVDDEESIRYTFRFFWRMKVSMLPLPTITMRP